MGDAERDELYFGLIARALRVCARYRPKFGQGRGAGLTLEQFQALYRSDPFYNWCGLDSPLMYAAHKAAGGMTSVYRQLGIGCQWVFVRLLQDNLGLSPEQATWTYRVPTAMGSPRTLALDGRIELGDVANEAARACVQAWLASASAQLLLPDETRHDIRGAVFEVRQGYKSKDAKRQQADLTNAANAYAHRYLPVLALLSVQIDADVASRYTQARWLLLTGTLTDNPHESTYAFARSVLGYDLAAFFERNSARLRHELEAVLMALLGQ